MNQMRPVAKRDSLYTLSLFALKFWLFRLKYILKLRKHTFKTSTNFSGLSPGLANARPPGRAKLANAPPPGLTRQANAPQLPGGGAGRSWNWLMHNEWMHVDKMISDHWEFSFFNANFRFRYPFTLYGFLSVAPLDSKQTTT